MNGAMMQTANNLLTTKVNHVKRLGMTLQSEHVKSGEALPDTAALLKKRSVTKIDDPTEAAKIRENKIYTTRDD